MARSSARSKRFVDRDIDAADPGIVHADMGDEVTTSIDDSQVHRLSDITGLVFSSSDYSLRASSRDTDSCLMVRKVSFGLFGVGFQVD